MQAADRPSGSTDRGDVDALGYRPRRAGREDTGRSPMGHGLWKASGNIATILAH